jgi:hypothetical protein
VIHASSLAVSREHRRAKTDRLDTELLKRGFLGWLEELTINQKQLLDTKSPIQVRISFAPSPSLLRA